MDECKSLPGAGISPVDIAESRTAPLNVLVTAGNSSATVEVHSVDVVEVMMSAAAAAVVASAAAAAGASSASAAAALVSSASAATAAPETATASALAVQS